ncbi:MAG: substrate-binding domain-containing protein [Bacilli bacterium]|jgi:phosphate transport system substrate-binding protein|nr:substrate-binding domain-containing protein [Bacilli bacterium]
MKKLWIIVLVFVFLLVGCQSKVDASIRVYTRDTTSGTRDGFFTTIGFLEAVSDNSNLANGYVELAGNGDIINAIKNDEYGIGYISLSSLAGSTLKGLTYNGVSPTEENVLNESYLLKRNFNYIVRTEFSSTNEEQIVTAFIAYLSTKEAKATVLGKDGIVAINESDPSWNDIKNDYPIHLADNSAVTIRFGGSTSVEKIAKALSAEFSTKCGNFQVEHNHTGSGDAFKRTQGTEKDGANAIHIGFASREFKLNDAEQAVAASYGKICVDAIVIVVHPNNVIEGLTQEQIRAIYQGSILLWSELE